MATCVYLREQNSAKRDNSGSVANNRGRCKSPTVPIVSRMPVRLPGSGEMKHGGDFVRLVPPEASNARTLCINKSWRIR